MKAPPIGGGGGPTRNRRPSFRGVLMQDVSHGKERVRKWPRSRGVIKNPKTLEQMENFRLANEACKYWAPANIAEVMRWREGTPFLVRDIQISIMYNRYALFQRLNGMKVFSVAARQDVSDSLDAICPLPGAMLFRTAEGWRYIAPPSDVGLVPVSQAEGPPVWQEQSASGATYERGREIPVLSEWSAHGVGAGAGAGNLSQEAFGLRMASAFGTAGIRFARYAGGVPGGNWKATYRMATLYPNNDGAPGHQMVITRNSSSGNLVLLTLAGNTLWVQRWNSYNSWNANAFNVASDRFIEGLPWRQIEWDGRWLRFRVSVDGMAWRELYANDSTIFGGTPDQIGWGYYTEWVDMDEMCQSFEIEAA